MATAHTQPIDRIGGGEFGRRGSVGSAGELVAEDFPVVGIWRGDSRLRCIA